ncbi:hypothetical protein [Massilia oculi]|uniref:hypothetical protein n=1 Tax=Massilia oculi TaxID=945844 RepID=UPI001AAE7F44|nr:hypothetical protein [Massilia oculi]
MIRQANRLAIGIAFALVGAASLVVADAVSQWLCVRIFSCAAAGYCPIDVCEGDARLDTLRLAVWVGPAVVFGVIAFAFGGRRRSLPAWLGLLAALVVAHSLIIAAFR